MSCDRGGPMVGVEFIERVTRRKAKGHAMATAINQDAGLGFPDTVTAPGAEGASSSTVALFLGRSLMDFSKARFLTDRA